MVVSDRSWNIYSNLLLSRKHGKTTYTTGLTLPSKKLQLFGTAEFHEDVDSPFLIVFVLTDTNFARTSNALGAT